MEIISSTFSPVLKICTEIASASSLIWVAKSEGPLAITLSGLDSLSHHVLPAWQSQGLNMSKPLGEGEENATLLKNQYIILDMNKNVPITGASRPCPGTEQCNASLNLYECTHVLPQERETMSFSGSQVLTPLWSHFLVTQERLDIYFLIHLLHDVNNYTVK